MAKPKTEQQMRRDLLATARRFGCDIEVKQIFHRYDNLLKNCHNELEKQQIGIMGLAELHKLLGCRGALIVNGQIILPADPNLKEED